MGQVMTNLHTWLIANHIRARHAHPGIRSGVQHRLENAMVDTLGKTTERVYVHWGAYESGKSRATKNAAIRLQAAGKLVMLLRGFDWPCNKESFRDWLRVGMGVPDDRADDKLSLFLNKPAVFIIDHCDTLFQRHCAKNPVDDLSQRWSGKYLVETLRELECPVLLVVSSWERAVELVKQDGCQLLGQDPGLGRWTEAELEELVKTLPIEGKLSKRFACTQWAILSGSPGVVQHDAVLPSAANMYRARLIEAEWNNGIRALNGEDMQGVTGRFPDKDGVFHWDGAHIIKSSILAHEAERDELEPVLPIRGVHDEDL